MFVGRTKELEQLKRFLSDDDFQTLLLYGRRRVGKSELIKEALKDSDAAVLYFEAREVSPVLNLQSLEKKIKETLSLPSFVHFASLEEAFEAIFVEAKKRKIVFALDEFTYLPILTNGENADASLAHVIDEYKGDSCHLKLIVSGSYVDVMTKMIEKNRPLHGRFTSTLLLKEFDYYEASLFFPEYSAEEKFKAYSCFSGLPYVLSLMNPHQSVEDNIKELYCKPDTILDLFVHETISAEMNKVEHLNTILSLIASGKTKHIDLLSVLGKEARIEYALDKLVNMDIIQKNYPINEKTNKKLTFYSFKDPLLAFFYRYIFSADTYREVQGEEVFFRENIQEDLAKYYLPKMFEEVAKEFLIRKNKRGTNDIPFSEIGTYFYNDRYNRKNLQFDVVTKDKNGYISYECKYMNKPLDRSILKEEQQQTAASSLPFYRLGFIAKEGFSEDFYEKGNYILYTLEDFYHVG